MAADSAVGVGKSIPTHKEINKLENQWTRQEERVPEFSRLSIRKGER